MLSQRLELNSGKALIPCMSQCMSYCMSQCVHEQRAFTWQMLLHLNFEQPRYVLCPTGMYHNDHSEQQSTGQCGLSIEYGTQRLGHTAQHHTRLVLSLVGMLAGHCSDSWQGKGSCGLHGAKHSHGQDQVLY